MIRHDLRSGAFDAPLVRRGLALGSVSGQRPCPERAEAEAVRAWCEDRPFWLPGWVHPEAHAEAVASAHRLMEAVLEAGRLEPCLDASPWRERLASVPFAPVAVSSEEHDPQAIEKVYFDAETPDGRSIEDLWCKASWLSFHEADASLRFRFSFGMEGFEDVAADFERECWAARLCETVFPESAALTGNRPLISLLEQALGGPVAFVERIVYFNAPEGGALMHHDVERGHAGVVYAQMSGETFWLALSGADLIGELRSLVAEEPEEVVRLLNEGNAPRRLANTLASGRDPAELLSEDWAEVLMNESARFIGRLVEKGFAYRLAPGDVLLLPQADTRRCVWHTVFTLGDAPGEGLSFAVRRVPENSG